MFIKNNQILTDFEANNHSKQDVHQGIERPFNHRAYVIRAGAVPHDEHRVTYKKQVVKFVMDLLKIPFIVVQNFQRYQHRRPIGQKRPVFEVNNDAQ